MFKPEYVDVQLSRMTTFDGIGDSDTLRVFEPSSSLNMRTYKDDEARQTAIINEMRKNIFILLNGDMPIEPDKKTNIFDYISIRDGKKIEKAFISFFPNSEEEENQLPK
jgi:hypothetical protein